jgi:hypothetical protein
MLRTYTVDQVAAMFSTDSSWWLSQGVREGKYPHLRVRRGSVRFTDEHVEQIRASFEVPATVGAAAGGEVAAAGKRAPAAGEVFRLSRRSRGRVV